MKSMTLAVIFASVLSYGTIYTQATAPSSGPTLMAISNEDPPLSSEPDDYEEEDRVTPRKTRRNERK